MRHEPISAADKAHYFEHGGLRGSEFDYNAVTPSADDYAAAIARFRAELPTFGVDSSFGEGAAATIVDTPSDDPTYVLNVELSNRAAVGRAMIDHLHAILGGLDERSECC